MFCLNAMAISVEAPTTVYLYGEEKEVLLRVSNQEDFSQNFEAKAIFPTAAGLDRYSGSIAANKSTNLRLSIHPDEALVGQTYEGRVEITLGEEKFVKIVRLVFRGQKEAEENGETEESNKGTTAGLFALASLALTPELALNIMLGFIAAILLIAFIARFVKRMEGR